MRKISILFLVLASPTLLLGSPLTPSINGSMGIYRLKAADLGYPGIFHFRLALRLFTADLLVHWPYHPENDTTRIAIDSTHICYDSYGGMDFDFSLAWAICNWLEVNVMGRYMGDYIDAEHAPRGAPYIRTIMPYKWYYVGWENRASIDRGDTDIGAKICISRVWKMPFDFALYPFVQIPTGQEREDKFYSASYFGKPTQSNRGGVFRYHTCGRVAPGGMILISKSTKTPSPISGYLNFGYQAKGKASEFQYGAGVDVLFFDYFDPFIEFWGRRRSFGEDPFGDHPPSYISLGFKWIGTGLSADLCVDFLVLGKREYDFHDFFPKDSAAAREAHVAPGWGERPTWAINMSMAYSYDFYNMRPVTNKAMIIGRVVDKVTQEGLDAVITATGAKRTISDPITGGYEVKVNPGKVNLVVSKKGYKDVVKVVDISRAQRIIVDIQMEPKVKHAIVTGKVIDKWSTEPIEDVEVTICRGEKTKLLTAATPGTMVKTLKGKLYKLNPETGAWELVRDTIREEDITTVMNGKVYKLDVVTGEWKEVKGETPGISEGDITSVIDGKLHKLNPITGEWEEVKGEVKFEDVVSEEDITKEIDGELYKLNVVTGKWEKVVVPVEEPEWAADTITLTQEKGLYRLDLIPPGTHLLKVKKKGYIPQVSPVVCKPNETSVVNFELFAKRIVLRGVHFEFDKATLLVDSYPILERVYKFLKENPELKVEIGGHTDWIASEEYNLELSLRRANAVRDYLIMHGIDPDRLTAKGYGESQPIADNTTEEGRALNRRIELKILEGGEGIDIEEWQKKKEE